MTFSKNTRLWVPERERSTNDESLIGCFRACAMTWLIGWCPTTEPHGPGGEDDI